MRHSISTFICFLLMALSQAPYAATDGEALGIQCNGCHGTGGVSSGPSIPSLAGLSLRYFMRTMMNFKKEKRTATIMDRLAQGYDIRELRNLSKYYASLEWSNSKLDFDNNKALSGKKLHDELCEECHEDNGRFQDKEVPRISGQTPDYLYMQLIDYHYGSEAMPQPEKMKERVEKLTLEDLDSLSHFYASGK